MPRLPDSTTRIALFLYPTEEMALKNERLGGTAFLIGRYMEGSKELCGQNLYAPYIVSNRHVVENGGAPVGRLNKRDGSPHIIPLEQRDWIIHPNGLDIAVAPAHGHIDRAEMDVTVFRENIDFITRRRAKEWQVGIGDEVVMVGRFINHQGRKQIQPAVRLGNISMMPEPIWHPIFKQDQLSYAVEMRSRTGFSGSPVAAYRTEATNIAPEVPLDKGFYGLLGVNWGYILEEGTGENTWLNGVIPAWCISEVLDTKKLKEYQRHTEEDLKRVMGGESIQLSVADESGMVSDADKGTSERRPIAS